MRPEDPAPRPLGDACAAEADAGLSAAGDSQAGEFETRLLAAKLESLAEFAAGAGHEINNPLAVISGRAQLLLRGEQDPERRRDLAIIHMQALRVHEMIADMMLFARPPQPKPARCDLSALVDRAVAGLKAKATTLGLTIERVGSGESIEAEVDGEQIQIAVRALIDNGLNAMRPGGRVEIELRSIAASDAASNAVEIIVRDDGPGIPDAEREHIFDPFFSGRQAGRGLGMGLAKAWRIVTSHCGTITADSPSVADPSANATAETTTRQGATFVVRLPRRMS